MNEAGGEGAVNEKAGRGPWMRREGREGQSERCGRTRQPSSRSTCRASDGSTTSETSETLPSRRYAKRCVPLEWWASEKRALAPRSGVSSAPVAERLSSHLGTRQEGGWTHGRRASNGGVERECDTMNLRRCRQRRAAGTRRGTRRSLFRQRDPPVNEAGGAAPEAWKRSRGRTK